MKNLLKKTEMYIIIVLLGILISTVGCGKEEKLQTTKEEELPTIKEDSIQFLKSALGGCNVDRSNIEAGIDTVIINLSNDTLNIFAGLNYVCCAPFITDCNMINDSIFISITDTCNNITQRCYCRCDCYYTFNYYFEKIGDKKYYFQILLFNPEEEDPILFYSGETD